MSGEPVTVPDPDPDGGSRPRERAESAARLPNRWAARASGGERVRPLRAVVAAVDATVRYGVGPDPDPERLRALRRAGAGAVCSSPEGLRAARDAGIAPARIHYAVGGDEDLEWVLGHCRDAPAMTLTVGSVAVLDRLANRGYGGRIALRVGPDEVQGGSERVPLAHVPEVAARVREDFRLVGLHAEGVDADGPAMDRVADLARRVEPREFVGVEPLGAAGNPLRAAADAVREALSGSGLDAVVEPARRAPRDR